MARNVVKTACASQLTSGNNASLVAAGFSTAVLVSAVNFAHDDVEGADVGGDVGDEAADGNRVRDREVAEA